jgi:hypothetical protein
MTESGVSSTQVRFAKESDVPALLVLMRVAAAEAVRRGCGLMKWQVARWNDRATRFYERLGATADSEWVDYSLSREDCERLGG